MAVHAGSVGGVGEDCELKDEGRCFSLPAPNQLLTITTFEFVSTFLLRKI